MAMAGGVKICAECNTLVYVGDICQSCGSIDTYHVGEEKYKHMGDKNGKTYV